VLATNEIIRCAKIHKQEGIILKIDSEKAYDRVRCTFFRELLSSMEFWPRWILWMKYLLVGV
jgi:hypothetical protein